MKILELIAIADGAYPEGLIGHAFATDENPGDTLALFVARELQETFCEDSTTISQLEEAERVVRMAISELEDVADAFHAESIRLLHP